MAKPLDKERQSRKKRIKTLSTACADIITFTHEWKNVNKKKK